MAFKEAKAEKQRRHLTEIMKKYEINLSGLAKLATLNRATLTRFYNEPRKPSSCLTDTTMSKIEEAINKISIKKNANLNSEITPLQTNELDSSVYFFDEKIEFFMLKSNSVELKGASEGDIVGINNTINPNAGDIVNVIVTKNAKKISTLRVYSPPLLVNCGKSCVDKPVYIIGVDDILIGGVVKFIVKKI